MARHNPLPADAEFVESEAPAPKDIGLGAPVKAQAVAASKPTPMTVEDLEAPPARPVLNRDSFLKKYPINKSVAVAFPPKQFQTREEKLATTTAKEHIIGRLV